MLGPQPEPPDVTDNSDNGDAGTEEPFADGDGDVDTDVDTDVDDGYAGEDPNECDPDVAGAEWDCGCDERDGHEPPGPFFESDVDGLEVRAPGRPSLTEEDIDDTDETDYDADGGPGDDDDDPTAVD
jgi:hypothetical protein